MQMAAVTWDINPIFISLGDLSIAYYGMLWGAAFLMGLYLFNKIVKREGRDIKMVDSAFIIMLVSTVVGARLGHCLFYEAEYFLSNPLEIVTGMRQGGLASHGAAIGLLVGIWIWSRKWKIPYVWMLDRIGIVVAIGGALIRFGNLLNSEVYGTATDLPWGFIFVRAGETEPMHPTQIYEIIAYLITFAVMMHLYWRTKLSDKRGAMFGVFLIMLFGARFIIESIKQPQESWEQAMALNMGQILSLPFIVAGIVITIVAMRRPLNPYTK